MRRALIVTALCALVIGLLSWAAGRAVEARWIWAAGTVPVAAGLLYTMVRDILAGRLGVDAIAFVSMAAALSLGEALPAVVVAVMYAGGGVLEDFAVSRAERDLKSLVDRAPAIAHRMTGAGIEDVPVDAVAVEDSILDRAGEIVPVDGVILSAGALLDEAAVLAGLLKAPSHYNPQREPEQAKARAQVVLTTMVETGTLTEVVCSRCSSNAVAVSGPSATRNDSSGADSNSKVAAPFLSLLIFTTWP